MLRIALLALAAIPGPLSDIVPANVAAGDPKDIAAIEQIEDTLTNAKSREAMRPYLDPKHAYIWDVVDHPRYGPDEVVRHIDEVLTSPEFKDLKPRVLYLEVEASPTVAFTNSIQNLVLRDATANIVFDSDYRVTNTYHKFGGKRLVVAEHLSFPVDPTTDKVFGRANLP